MLNIIENNEDLEPRIVENADIGMIDQNGKMQFNLNQAHFQNVKFLDQ